ncbi:uncharacterized protein LOC129594606 [Paramacrobiotus metropolitanus]|uniref:uncharacterized protein LOC129594606 n=1 Tax=Paramacrobiotus metropolitanus TaxID=2943436 RepID=UPI0024455F46|nr:uncharacterized protein LOC129594606 [Paramacrobiotus metropolitanus]
MASASCSRSRPKDVEPVFRRWTECLIPIRNYLSSNCQEHDIQNFEECAGLRAAELRSEPWFYNAILAFFDRVGPENIDPKPVADAVCRMLENVAKCIPVLSKPCHVINIADGTEIPENIFKELCTNSSHYFVLTESVRCMFKLNFPMGLWEDPVIQEAVRETSQTFDMFNTPCRIVRRIFEIYTPEVIGTQCHAVVSDYYSQIHPHIKSNIDTLLCALYTDYLEEDDYLGDFLDIDDARDEL